MSFAVVMQAHTDHSTGTTVIDCPEKCYGTTAAHTQVLNLAQAIIYTPDLRHSTALQNYNGKVNTQHHSACKKLVKNGR